MVARIAGNRTMVTKAKPIRKPIIWNLRSSRFECAAEKHNFYLERHLRRQYSKITGPSTSYAAGHLCGGGVVRSGQPPSEGQAVSSTLPAKVSGLVIGSMLR